MKEDLLKKLLESILGRSKSARGGDEAVFKCPSCNHHKNKLTFNLLSQKFQCWVCGYKGHRAFQLLKKANAPGASYSALKEIDQQYNFKNQVKQKVDTNILTLILSFSPGGIYEVAVIAIAFDLDPDFVAFHHIIRLLFILFTVPIFLRILEKLKK